MLLGDPRQSDQRTQSFHFPIVVHQSLDPAAQSSAHASAKLLVFTCTSKFERWTSSERVDALGLRAVEVIICMITRDFSVISMMSQSVSHNIPLPTSLVCYKWRHRRLSLSLSLPLTKVTDAQYRKRFRASYNKLVTNSLSLPDHGADWWNTGSRVLKEVSMHSSSSLRFEIHINSAPKQAGCKTFTADLKKKGWLVAAVTLPTNIAFQNLCFLPYLTKPKLMKLCISIFGSLVAAKVKYRVLKCEAHRQVQAAAERNENSQWGKCQEMCF